MPQPEKRPEVVEEPQSGSSEPVTTESRATTAQPLADEEPAPVSALDDPNVEVHPGDVSAGQGKAAVCAACHGADGNSIDPQYPKLAGMPERYIARQLALFKTGERPNPIMQSFAAPLSAQDMRDIGAFFASQQALPGVADDTAIADGPNEGARFYEVGETLFRAGDRTRGIPACMACHGPDGAGNPGPAYPSLAGQHAQYTATKLQMFRDGDGYGEGESENLVMVQVAANLTDEEIQSLATYVEGLHAVADEAPASDEPQIEAAAAPAGGTGISEATPETDFTGAQTSDAAAEEVRENQEEAREDAEDAEPGPEGN
ncbi:cytochrome c4 [Coralloluteibacterium stylophorae]|uniref:Cytochrome c4 n=2 Tax=Coralloluteibacterium stylophorae TaxID=1776034 RepID=A0A8J8B107_9GAMM|nr:cytochrome c4 [Coralloluteibacterium stylophorae]